jgi:hypothetical protein
MTIKDENSLALLAFNVGSNQFDINRGLAYISMRDQVLRGRTLVNAAMGAALFDQRSESPQEDADAPVDYDVTVLGAGVGGMSVALAAVEKGLRVLVIDKSQRCFELLRSGTDRLLSTTVYDWPADHFSEHAFPWLPGITRSGMKDEFILKFPKHALRADELADHLQAQVQTITKKHPGNLRIAHGVEISGNRAIAPLAGRCVLVNPGKYLPLLDGTSQLQVTSRIVVYAFGFGSEKVMMSAAPVNASFWGYATLEADLGKLAKKPGRGQVAVQGAGDGGLQEALRFALAPDWQDLSKVISELEKAVAPHFPQWDNRLRRIMLAEDNAARAYMWGYSQESVFESVDQAHQDVIDELLKELPKQVGQWFDTVGRKQELQITVYDKHAFSGRVYALNRFLFKLLLKFTAEQPVQVKVVRESTVMPHLPGAIRVDRSGLAQIYSAVGTGTKSDYLRRATLRAIPNQYGVIG